ncbi:aminopeptidase [Chthonomonas calidirosea]|uniref:Leucyl aminopeptidase (Aminopeptidase T) n=1 Tax=Chthonomonas calidirosea (strain DSM 23976 / ICMP 18418 / T49) TaxID=1303518 RepID=S0ESG1_CHTCT|nr:aminopeptidase [Chthonomonas calidirosea]CCW34139.1 Leucyl aminopeptidase (aminopeptidase T) [Chthonomonas calidirosea T49]CEK14490.1 leucyl aminopeptidase (aminopeptidase T) [Chthonomonas calidirosea]CEK15648.1 leucyl aminopeptidase (aminopeptidase T) [Chthonomonas calidirosea]
MRDPRYEKLAKLLVTHSMKVKSGDKVLIEAFDIPVDFTVTLIRAVAEAGGEPLVSTYHQQVLRALFQVATEDQMCTIGSVERARMEAVQCYVGVRGSHNITELSDVPSEKMALYEKFWWHYVHSEVRVPKTRWVVLRWPHPSMAQAAGMSTEAFEDFYFRVCTEVDYAKMAQAMEPLRELMESTDRVRIVGPGTELTFSIQGIPAVGCAGERNIPDGELFTCPVRDSVEGTIQFNCETLYRGTLFQNIRLTFKRGRIVEATAQAETEKLNAILDTDEGARYIGEWSLAFNPWILKPMKDILFDEKIAGSFHLTPGQAYEEADNGNRSQIHWDMVCIQRPEYGGGEIYFDDKLIRKDGLFVLEELAGLNPDRLVM